MTKLIKLLDGGSELARLAANNSFNAVTVMPINVTAPVHLSGENGCSSTSSAASPVFSESGNPNRSRAVPHLEEPAF